MAWLSLASVVAPVIHAALVGVAGGSCSLPPRTNLSTMAFLSKAVPIGDIEPFSHDAGALCPLR